jgi:hypothetical protein
MVEEWRPITDYPDYEVSNTGNVRRTYKNGRVKILRPADNGEGYKNISLCSDGNAKTFLVHRLVALAFIDLVGGKLTVDHINRDKNNNNVENLRWADRYDQNRNTCRYRTDIEEQDPKLRQAMICKLYHINNKDRINAKAREKIQCECGVSVCRNYIHRHRTSDKHTKRLLNNLIENEN